MKEAVHVPHQVLSAASHELRGPLGVARGYLRLLETQVSGDPQALKCVTQASRATGQMAALLDDVSRYARLARGEVRLHPAITPLAPIVAEAIPRIALPDGARVEVTSEVPLSATVWADAAATAEFCAAMGTALARAAVEGGTLVFRCLPAASGGDLELAVGHAEAVGTAYEMRAPRLDRSGMGLGLALAELSLRLQDGSLAELWADNRWGGYVLSFRTPSNS